MKNLIKHLLIENEKQILERSLKNCHVKGLHSIMLRERPGETIRLYIATNDHELNNPLALAYHPHHCNLTIDVIRGRIYNWIAKVDVNGEIRLNRYYYNSQITKGKIGFQLLQPEDRLKVIDKKRLWEREAAFMKASDIHTVIVDPFQEAAWMVYEGKEDERYQPFCWSSNDLENFNSEGLYQKFSSMKEIKDLLENVARIEF
jgi:hypothetical protein